MLIRIKPNTFNVVKGKEDYNTLNQALANVTNDVNGLIKDEITGDELQYAPGLLPRRRLQTHWHLSMAKHIFVF